MKKKIWLLSLMFVLLGGAFCFSGCFGGGDEPPAPEDLKIICYLNGEVFKTYSYDGTSVTLPTAPAKKGYEFGGWYVNGELEDIIEGNYRSNIIVNGVYNAIKYPITYILGGGTNAPENPDYYTIEDTITLKPPTLEGFKPHNYWVNEQGAVLSSTISAGSTGAKTFRAKWSVTTHVHPSLTHYDAVPATCTEKGLKERWKCEDCGFFYSSETSTSCYIESELATSRLYHTLMYYSHRPATTESAGWKAYEECLVCDYTTYVELPALQKDSQNLVYQLSEDQTYYTLTDGTQFTSSALVVPSQYNGLPVKKIGENAFLNNKNLRYLEISNAITDIALGAFSGCSNLETLITPFTGLCADMSANDLSISHFGAIFGTTEYEGSRKTWNSDGSHFYVPQALSYIHYTGTYYVPRSFYNAEIDLLIAENVEGVIDTWTRDIKSIEIFASTDGFEFDEYDFRDDYFYKYGERYRNVDSSTSYYGYNGICYLNGLTYVYSRDLNTAVVADADPNLEEIEIPSTITVNGSVYTVDCIGPGAFAEFGFVAGNNRYVSNLKKITLPATIKNIGPGAFEYSSVEEVVIPQNSALKYIGKNAFISSKIKSIYIPTNVKFLSYTFMNCKELETIEFAEDSKLEWIGPQAFQFTKLTKISIPSGVKSIGRYAFCMTQIEEIELPILNGGVHVAQYEDDTRGAGISSLAYIFDMNGNGAGNNSDRYNVTVYDAELNETDTLEMPKALKRVIYTGAVQPSKTALNGLKGIESISFKNEAYKQIDISVSGCEGLEAVYIPDYVTSLNLSGLNENTVLCFESSDFATNYCNNIDNGTKPVKYVIDGNYFIDGNLKYSIINENEVAVLGLTNANFNDKKLDEVVIPKTVMYNEKEYDVTKINAFAFSNFKGGTIVIPDSITEIGVGAFYKSNLETIEIPTSVTTICKNAFVFNTDALTVICVKAESQPEGWNENWANGFPDGHILFNAQVVTVNDCKYATYGENKAITLGATYANGEAVIPETFTFNEQTYTVTGIGPRTYGEDWVNVVHTLTLPKTITKVYEGATAQGSSVKRINFGGSLENWINIDFVAPAVYGHNIKLYVNDDQLVENVDFTGRTIIPDNVFRGILINEVVIPDNVTYIGDYAFQYSQLKNTTITLPATLTYLGEGSFWTASKIKTVTFAEGINLTKIGAYAFRSCGIDYLTIPDCVKEIGEEAFQSNGIKTLTLGAGIEVIGLGAFTANNMVTVNFPASLRVIGTAAFSHCKYLEEITFANDNTGVEIGANAFKFCDKLNNVNLPAKSIGYDAFASCTTLTNITLTYSDITSIGQNFIADTLVESIVLPEGVVRVEANAFAGVTTLTAIYSKAESQPENWSNSWNPNDIAVYWYSEEQPEKEGNYWHYENGEIVVWEPWQEPDVPMGEIK